MRVQVVYRNYIPLNSPYSSFWNNPPKGVEFLIPPTKAYLKHFFPIYRMFGRLPGFRWAVQQVTKHVFSNARSAEVDSDCLFYVGICPEKPPEQPYYIDIEHANALVDFLGPDAFERARPRLLEVLGHPLCRGIVPISEAAARSLELAFGKDYERIRSKVKVIYPSLPVYKEVYSGKVSREFIPERRAPDELNLLFVGKESLRKGLPQVLEAFTRVQRRYPKIRLFVVSDTPDHMKSRYADNLAIRFWPTKFTTFEVMTKFFLPADVFVMPTLEDSYGMVFMEALSCGKPVVLTRQFATPEIVREGVNGLFLDLPPLGLDRQNLTPPRSSGEYVVPEELRRKMVDELERKLSAFLEDPELLDRLTVNATIDFGPDGKFSDACRNRSLIELFSRKS